jgi:hypothetical protein
MLHQFSHVAFVADTRKIMHFGCILYLQGHCGIHNVTLVQAEFLPNASIFMAHGVRHKV